MVNPGHDIELVDEWSIRSAPTLVLVEDGEEVARLAEGSRAATTSRRSSTNTRREPRCRTAWAPLVHCTLPFPASRHLVFL